MNQEENNNPKWLETITVRAPSFKINDGETKTLTFLDNGEPHYNSETERHSIKFAIEHDGIRMNWFVNTKAGIIQDIVRLGFPLKGKTIFLTRVGSGMRDTRYKIEAHK